MLLLATSSSEPVEKALTFAQEVFEADCAAFYRIDPTLQPYDYTLRDVSPDFHRHYIERMNRYDPLHVRSMVAQASLVGQIEASTPENAQDRYGAFLGAFGVSVAVELLFSSDAGVYGGMCVMWRSAPADLEALLRHARSVRAYLEFTLRPPQSRLARFGLTSRETDVAKLLCCGRTNPEIAEMLGIGIATVKTHLINVYTKLGVETRAAAAGLLSSR